MANLDAWVVTQDSELSREIVLLDIDNDEYQKTFEGHSPLKPEEVTNLISLIAKAGAGVIIVDIDTTDWTEQNLTSGWLKPAAPDRLLPIVIWARTTQQVDGGPIVLSNVAGRKDTTMPTNDQTLCWGVPKVLESGGLLRAYPRYITLGKTAVPSLAAAAAAAFHDPRPHYEKTGSINCNILSRNFDDGPSAAVLRTGSRRFARYHPAELREFMAPPVVDQATPLSGKVVILGGSFAAARDSYWTARGQRDGIEILATAIDSELNKPMSLEKSAVLFYVIDVLVGLLILLVSQVLPKTWSLLFVVLAVPAAAFAGSLFAFWSGYFASFMPVLAGVFFHKLFDDWWEARKSGEKPDDLTCSEESLSERTTLTTVRITEGRV
jgi:CHASE2 domain-containing sensor protein